MFSKAKYVILKSGGPIVFSELLAHADVARALGQAESAGFCVIDSQGQYACFGDSISLKMKSRPVQDSDILNRYLGVME